MFWILPACELAGLITQQISLGFLDSPHRIVVRMILLILPVNWFLVNKDINWISVSVCCIWVQSLSLDRAAVCLTDAGGAWRRKCPEDFLKLQQQNTTVVVVLKVTC